jgi:hypothetical protein
VKDLAEKASLLSQAQATFDSAALRLVRGHNLLAQAGEVNCKTKQWLRCALQIANELESVASKARKATETTEAIQRGRA